MLRDLVHHVHDYRGPELLPLVLALLDSARVSEGYGGEVLECLSTVNLASQRLFRARENAWQSIVDIVTPSHLRQEKHTTASTLAGQE